MMSSAVHTYRVIQPGRADGDDGVMICKKAWECSIASAVHGGTEAKRTTMDSTAE